jgi:hypothetical protein
MYIKIPNVQSLSSAPIATIPCWRLVFREFNVQISPTVPSQVYPQKFPKKLAANEKVLARVGDLKPVSP